MTDARAIYLHDIPLDEALAAFDAALDRALPGYDITRTGEIATEIQPVGASGSGGSEPGP